MANFGVKFGIDDAFAYKWSEEEQAVFLYGTEGLYTIWDIAAPDIMISDLWFESLIEKLYEKVGIDYTIENG